MQGFSCIIKENLHVPTIPVFRFPTLLTVVHKNTMENKDMLFHLDCIVPKKSNYISFFPAFTLNGNQSLLVID